MAIRLRIGTRKSVMALAQTEEIARRLTAAAPDIDVEIVKFETTGDSDQVGKLLPHGGKGGAFVAEIRRAVLKGELHAAMHSLKDMPGNEDTPGLVIGATLKRDPPEDVLVLRKGVSIDDLKRSHGKGFKIGTNAVRRAAYARRLFPDAEVIYYRGAADTRVRKLDGLELQRLPMATRSGRGCADHGALRDRSRRPLGTHRLRISGCGRCFPPAPTCLIFTSHGQQSHRWDSLRNRRPARNRRPGFLPHSFLPQLPLKPLKPRAQQIAEPDQRT